MSRFVLLLSAALWPCLVWAADPEWPELSRPPSGLVRDGGNDAALVIAIEDYAFAPDLPGARQNALDWVTHLEEGQGVRTVKPLFDEQAAREDMLAEIAQVAARVRPDGKFWLVFIGHGAPSRDGADALLEGVDARQTASSLESRGVRRSEVVDAIEGNLVAGASAVVVLDACFSGQTASGDLAPGLAPLRDAELPSAPRVSFITAAKNDQYAGPLPDGSRPAFSYFLLGAMRGWGDTDRRVTISEAVDFVDGALLKTVTGRNQSPTFDGPDLVLSSGGREEAPRLAQLAARVGTGTASSTGFGDLKLDVDARLREQECQVQAVVDGAGVRSARLQKMAGAVRDEADAAWARLRPSAQKCLQITKAERREDCAATLDAFAARAASARVELPAGMETVPTACGPIELAFVAEVQVVQVPATADAQALATQLRVIPTNEPPVTAKLAAKAAVTRTVPDLSAGVPDREAFADDDDVEEEATPAARRYALSPEFVADEGELALERSRARVNDHEMSGVKPGDLLIYSSIGLGAIGLTTLAISGGMRDAYLAADASAGEQSDLVEVNNGLGYTGYTFVGLAGGLFAIGAAFRW